jgi:hypothetical protein
VPLGGVHKPIVEAAVASAALLKMPQSCGKIAGR